MQDRSKIAAKNAKVATPCNIQRVLSIYMSALITAPTSAIVLLLEEIAADAPATLTEDCDFRHVQAFDMKSAGRPVQSIADHFKVDRVTVWRWIKDYETKCCNQLAQTPVINHISKRLLEIEQIRRKSLEVAETTTSERTKLLALNEALKATAKAIEISIEAGIIPRDPTRIYSVVERHKPRSESAGDTRRKDRTKEELIDQLLKQIAESEVL